MTQESRQQQMESIKNKIKNIGDEDIRNRLTLALDALNEPVRPPIVTSAINRARKVGYTEIALEIASLAHEFLPSNSYILNELCIILLYRNQPQSVIEEIHDFIRRGYVTALSQSERDSLMVTLAHAYQGVSNIPEGIRVLEELDSDNPAVLEALAELYYVDGKPMDTIELLQQKKGLSRKMALWLAKAYGTLLQWTEAKEILEPFKEASEIREYYREVATRTSISPKIQEGKTRVIADPKKVFVVSGRNETMRRNVFTFLRAIGLEPIEWAQAVAFTKKGAPFIGEVLDLAFDSAQAIIVVMTGDDEAKLRDEYLKPSDPDYERVLSPQARPNVIFEAGMAFGRHPERTILVELGNLRPFSDIAGRHLLKLDNTAEKRHELAQRLKTARCHVDLTGTDWLTIGDFRVIG